MPVHVIMAALMAFIASLCFAFDEEACTLTQEKSCVDYGERVIDGHATTQCWQYEQKHLCVGQEKNHCQMLEENRGCNELSGACIKSSPLGSCEHFEKLFVCGKHLAPKEETRQLGTEFTVIRDEKDVSACQSQALNDGCELAEEVCSEGPETRNIQGKAVHKDCWAWERKYVCRTNSVVDECAELKADCKEIGKVCLFERAGVCEHLELRYQCSERQVRTKPCIASQFCIGGNCETKQRTRHRDFGGISYLSILAGMASTDLEGCQCPSGKASCQPGEIDPTSCRFFAGQASTCRNHTGEFNCCSDKGFLRSAFQCEQQEKDLHAKRKIQLCHHVGTRRGKGLEFFKKWQSHCCFKSKLAHILQAEGRKQLGLGWGDAKHPDCRALTLAELQQIDFSTIDFSALFHEMEEKASSSIEAKKAQMQDKVEQLHVPMSDVIRKKMRHFYGGQK